MKTRGSGLRKGKPRGRGRGHDAGGIDRRADRACHLLDDPFHVVHQGQASQGAKTLGLGIAGNVVDPAAAQPVEAAAGLAAVIGRLAQRQEYGRVVRQRRRAAVGGHLQAFGVGFEEQELQGRQRGRIAELRLDALVQRLQGPRRQAADAEEDRRPQFDLVGLQRQRRQIAHGQRRFGELRLVAGRTAGGRLGRGNRVPRDDFRFHARRSGGVLDLRPQWRANDPRPRRAPCTQGRRGVQEGLDHVAATAETLLGVLGQGPGDRRLVGCRQAIQAAAGCAGAVPPTGPWCGLQRAARP